MDTETKATDFTLLMAKIYRKRESILELIEKQGTILDIKPIMLPKLDGALEVLHWLIDGSSKEGWIEKV